MMQWIHDRMSKVFWLFMAPLTVVFTLWGVHGVVDFSSRSDKALKVNGEEVAADHMRNAYQERVAQLARLYPEEIPADVKKSTQDAIVDQYVDRTLIDQKAKELRFAVSDQDVIASIQSYSGFQVEGKFNKDAYLSLLKAQGYTPERFEGEQRSLLKARSLESSLMLSSFSTPAELARAAALQGETRELGYAVLPVAKFLATAKPDEAAVKAYYEAHKDSFNSPDRVHLSYVALRVADVAHEVQADEAALRAYYDTVKERFVEAEKRRARHILIPAGKDEAAAKKKAEEVYALAMKPGADFAALAREYSQDAGSAAQGGDLGLVEKSFFVGPFAEAVFSMKTGETRGPVKTQFGWHVIKLEEIAPGKTRAFEDVKAELAGEYQKVEAERRFGERQEKIEQLAFESGGSLEPVAKALGLKIEDIADFHAGLAGNELARNPKVMKAAFSADVLGGQNSRAIELSPGNVVVVRASDRRLPAAQTLEAVHEAALAGARRELADRQTQAAADSLAAALAAGTTWEAALKPLGGGSAVVEGKDLPAEAIRYAAPKFVARTDRTLPPDVLKAVFRAVQPAAGKPVSAALPLADGSVAVYALTAVKAGEVKPGDLMARQQLSAKAGQGDFVAYLAALRARSDVRIPPSIFD
jgi:peptidyl-prolyl cis-trans isomerase D